MRLSHVAGVITAAGSSKRMGGQLKKEYMNLEGCPMLVWSIRPFLTLSTIGQIIVTLPEGDLQKVKDLLQPFLDMKKLKLITGGASRQESVFYALKELEKISPDCVLIHDGARPWVTLNLIERVLEATLEYGACIPVGESPEAPKLIGSSGFILKNLDRRQVRIAQTPQGFSFLKILQAHKEARNTCESCVDDAEVYSSHIGPVFTVRGEIKNIKVTYREDLEL